MNKVIVGDMKEVMVGECGVVKCRRGGGGEGKEFARKPVL